MTILCTHTLAKYSACALTATRFASIPLLIYWLQIKPFFEGALCVFAFAAVTDFLDGFIARRFHATTALGAALDPLADKALSITLFYILWQKNCVPSTLFALMIVRDLMIVSGYSFLKHSIGTVTIHPLLISKLFTATQFLCITAILIHTAITHTWPQQGALWMQVFLIFLWTGAMLSLVGYAKQGHKLWTASSKAE